MTPFVIAGCGRSGTMGMARLLNAAGVRASFESFFRAGRDPSLARGFVDWLRISGLDGEVSSFASPFLRRGVADFVVLHQVRNPVAVAASVLGHETWTAKAAWPNVVFALGCLPEIGAGDDPLTKTLKWWIGWNHRVDSAGPIMRWRIEDASPRLLADVLARIGADVSESAVAAAFAGYDRTHNGGPRAALRWSDVPEGDLKDRVCVMAAGYGYSERDLADCRPTNADADGGLPECR